MTFTEWFDQTFRDLDGGTTGIPSSLADDLLVAWNAGHAEGSRTPAPAASQPGLLTAEQVEWVVNDIAELGVKIGNQFFWLYKGHSLVYGHSEEERAAGVCLNEDTDPPTKHMWRPVFKREFGECCHPINRKDPTLIGTVSPGDSDDWKPLPPAAPPARSAASTVEPVSLRQMARRIEEALNSEFGVAEGYGNASWTVAHHLYAAPTTSPEPDAVREKIVKLVEEIMLDKWNDICSDTECHPLDIKQLGRRKLEFSPNHWTRFVGEALAETLAALSRPAHGGELERLRAALTKIEKWFGEFPATGKFWDEQKTDEMSYSACYGSNGERDYMRGVARDALARNDRQTGGTQS